MIVNYLWKTGLLRNNSIIKQNLKPGNILRDQLENGGDLSFRKYYKKNEKPHLVFRLFNNRSIVILDFELGYVRKKIVIKNGYNYVTGEFWGESFYKRFNLGLKFRDQPRTIEKATKFTLLTNQLINEGEFEKAQKSYKKIPIEFKNNSTARLLEIKIAANSNEKKYIQLMDKYIQTKKDDIRFVAINNLLKFATLGDSENVIKNIALLNKEINNDDLLDFYISMSYNIKNDYVNAKKYIIQFRKNHPTLFDGILLDLEIELTQNNLKNAIQLLEDIKLNFDIDKETINNLLVNYTAFKKTPAYLNFITNYN